MNKIKTLAALTLAAISFTSFAQTSVNESSGNNIGAGFGMISKDATGFIVNGTFNIDDNIYGNFSGAKSLKTDEYSLLKYQFGVGYKIMPLSDTMDLQVEIGMSSSQIDIDGDKDGTTILKDTAGDDALDADNAQIKFKAEEETTSNTPISLLVGTKLNENISIEAGVAYNIGSGLNLNILDIFSSKDDDGDDPSDTSTDALKTAAETAVDTAQTENTQASALAAYKAVKEYNDSKDQSYNLVLRATYQMPITDMLSAGARLEYDGKSILFGAGVAYRF